MALANAAVSDMPAATQLGDRARQVVLGHGAEVALVDIGGGGVGREAVGQGCLGHAEVEGGHAVSHVEQDATLARRPDFREHAAIPHDAAGAAFDAGMEAVGHHVAGAQSRQLIGQRPVRPVGRLAPQAVEQGAVGALGSRDRVAEHVARVEADTPGPC